MAKTKGIRVSQLAKELGVPSKAIVEKCKAEGLGDKVPNHMSVLSLGLAATVREWFAGSQSATHTAVETAPPVAAELLAQAKAKRPVRRRKKAAAEAGAETTIAEAAPAPPEALGELPAPPAPEGIQAAPEPEPAAQPPAAAEPAVEPVLPPAVVAPPVMPPALQEAPARVPEPSPAEAPPAAVPVPQEVPPLVATEAPPAPPAPIEPPAAVPEVPPKRKPVIPAPKLVIPEPAKIQGPRIVRQEEPEVVPAPRPKRTQADLTPPVFVQARPHSGRGVKSTIEDEGEEIAEAKRRSKGGRTLSSRRRGPDGRRGEAMEKIKEYTEADLIERRDRLAAASSYRAGFDSELKKRAERAHHAPAKPVVQRGQPVSITEPISVRGLSAALGVKSSDILGRLLKKGVMASINQSLDRQTAEMLASEYGVQLSIRQQPTLEEQMEQEFAQRPRKPENLVPRPPVVAVLGHVDHGKTSLLDRIRKTNVAAGEAGGITQHIAAWMVELGPKRVTFIDTPGHQAFTSMRARGAHMTDLVVLVVSAAEGVQPQTVESIHHARAAKVPIVVALNKIDRADANPDMVLGQLAKEGLNPAEWGGDVEVVRTSALTGQGIPELIEVLDYQAELLELKADPTAPARGVVVESSMDEGLGPVATVLVQDGTLQVGQVILAGTGYGRVRSLLNDRGQMVNQAGPSVPVIVSGLSDMPMAGERFHVLDDLDRARAIAEERQNRARQAQLATQNRVTLANILETIKAGQTKIINLIIKADVQGSVETLAKTVTEYNTDEVKVQVIHAAVGPITESDVELAAATTDENSSTVIIGFHIVPDEQVRQLAEQRRVEIRLYRVIYEIFDDLKKALSGMLEPEIREKLHGHLEIRQVFRISRVGNVAGCYVTDGHIQRGSKLRLIRDSVVVAEDLSLESLKRMKDDVREVRAGLECGIKIAGYDDIKVGDRLEAYARETIHRTL